MGALPPLSPWLPEDDLLLKNAVEAGASLESLSKGAVRFSRRFTIQELQERWQSLLYDPDIATQASAHMVELELSASISLSSQSNKSGHSKGNGNPGKRKEESVRSHYFAMRKRICNEPFNNMDLSFLTAPNIHDYTGTGGCEELTIHNQHPSGNCMIGDPVGFDFDETDFDIVHPDFSLDMRAENGTGSIEGASHAFHSGDGVIDGNCLYPYTDNVPSVTANEVVRNDLGHSFQPESIHKNISHVLGENMPVFDGNQCVQEMRAPADSYHHMEYSSPGPPMSLWRTMGDLSLPDIPTVENFDEKHTGGAPTADNGKNMSSSGFAVSHPEPHMDDMSGVGVRSSNTMCEGDFNHYKPEDVYLDADGKEVFERSCLDHLNSLLMSSPSDIHHDDTHPDHISDIVSSWDPHPERRNGVICCTLNTEDPEVPCNDDVDLSTEEHPPLVSSGMEHKSKESNNLVTLSTKDNCFDQKPGEEAEDHANREHLLPNSWPTESQELPQLSNNNPIDDSGLKSELPSSNSLAVISQHTLTAGGELSQCTSLPLSPYQIPVGELNPDALKADLPIHCNFDNSIEFQSERPLHDSDHMQNHPQNLFVSIKQQEDVPVSAHIHVLTHLDQVSVEMPSEEQVINPSTSGHEDQHSENDDDLPSFSDVEAMILELDLVPSDQESCFSREVARYQYEETKRAIIRLEQGAYSCMQRAIASHRAFAVIYGRYLKYYIKKPEVILGRATDDFDVDIDLAKEGRANKISRRQGLIKMEEDGSFCLKNLGKGSIIVNSKEVAPGHSIKLGSSCLIEIRSMRFIFELSQTAVKQFLSTKLENRQDTNSKVGMVARGL